MEVHPVENISSVILDTTAGSSSPSNSSIFHAEAPLDSFKATSTYSGI